MINDILKKFQLKLTLAFLKKKRSLKLLVGGHGVLSEDDKNYMFRPLLAIIRFFIRMNFVL